MANAIIAPGTTDLSDYSSRQVTIEVMGGTHQEMTRTGTYVMTVPYKCFSQTMQRVHRFGGKVINVTIPHHDYGEGLLVLKQDVSSPQPVVEQAKPSDHQQDVSSPQPAAEQAKPSDHQQDVSSPQPAAEQAKSSDHQQDVSSPQPVVEQAKPSDHQQAEKPTNGFQRKKSQRKQKR